MLTRAIPKNKPAPGRVATIKPRPKPDFPTLSPPTVSTGAARPEKGDEAKIEKEVLRRSNIIKALAAAILLLGLGSWTLPATFEYINRAEPVDYGLRPLVVFSIPAGDDVTGLYFKWFTSKDEKVQLQYFLTANNDIDREIPVSLSFFYNGNSADSVQCDTAGTTSPVPFLQLPIGVRNAAEVDKASTGPVTTGAAEELDENDSSVVTHWAQLKPRKWINPDDDKSFDPAKGHCELPSDWVWQHSGPTVTALLPEVDLVRSDWTSANVYNTRPHGEVVMTRSPGFVISESYPAMNFMGGSMRATIDTYPNGNGEMGYSAQPTVILTERSSLKSDNVTLMLVGISFGFIGGLVIYLGDSLFSICVSPRIKQKLIRKQKYVSDSSYKT